MVEKKTGGFFGLGFSSSRWCIYRHCKWWYLTEMGFSSIYRWCIDGIWLKCPWNLGMAKLLDRWTWVWRCVRAPWSSVGARQGSGTGGDVIGLIGWKWGDSTENWYSKNYQTRECFHGPHPSSSPGPCRGGVENYETNVEKWTLVIVEIYKVKKNRSFWLWRYCKQTLLRGDFQSKGCFAWRPRISRIQCYAQCNMVTRIWCLTAKGYTHKMSTLMGKLWILGYLIFSQSDHFSSFFIVYRIVPNLCLDVTTCSCNPVGKWVITSNNHNSEMWNIHIWIIGLSG